MTPTTSPAAERAHHDDDATESPAVNFLDLARHLSTDERQRLLSTDRSLQQSLRPASIDPWNREEFPHHLLPGLAELGLGETFMDGSSQLFQGMVHAAAARADVSMSALLGIHNELIVGTIAELGSEEHKETWLPGFAAWSRWERSASLSRTTAPTLQADWKPRPPALMRGG